MVTPYYLPVKFIFIFNVIIHFIHFLKQQTMQGAKRKLNSLAFVASVMADMQQETSRSWRPTCRVAVLLALTGASCLHAADTIYVSYDAEGTPRFASHPYDHTYVPFLIGQSAVQTTTVTQPGSRRLQNARQKLESIIQVKARQFNVAPALLRAVIHTESAFEAHAVSPKGAIGAMQLLPATAMRYGGTDLSDPSTNIEIGARHLGLLLKQFDGNLPLALAAYNSGEGAVKRHAKRIPPYRETMLYVPTVLTRYGAYRQAEVTPPTDLGSNRASPGSTLTP